MVCASIDDLPDPFLLLLVALFASPTGRAHAHLPAFVTITVATAIVRTGWNLASHAFVVRITITLCIRLVAGAVSTASSGGILSGTGVCANGNVEPSHIVRNVAIEMKEHGSLGADNFWHPRRGVALVTHQTRVHSLQPRKYVVS